MYHAIVLAQEKAPEETGGQTPPSSPFTPGFLVPFVLILVLMYFVMLRPQRKQQKRHQEMLSQISKNDQVVTIGGVHGIVYAVGDKDVTLKVDERNDVRLRVAKSAIARVLTEEEAASGTPSS